ncbi:endolytic transglycosylase MltG [Candidatus Kaiserbacteria bacterium]|nr:endolytic transglycosylase MltG [Candidatus Kaiserbacteria bacterium]
MDVFRRHAPWFVSFALALLLLAGYQILFAAPDDFPRGSTIGIARGTAATRIAEDLADARVIKHPALLQLLLYAAGESAAIQAGAYRFEKPQNLFVVASRLVTGAYGLPPVRVTFFEGITVREAAEKVTEALPDISQEDFLKEAQPYEGYLFPDTYFFSPSSDAASVAASMRGNFNEKISALAPAISATGRTLSDIVILASLVEKEARTSESRRLVAGILSNRLKLGMPLQVDAVFGYIFDRDTYSPSLKDLTVDSPYNTYTHTGLPPGPIDNPGLDSLEAVVHPTKTDYLYYLTGKDGVMHYAITYAGHQTNRKKYLD